MALPGKAMIVNLVSLVNELVNGLNGQLKMVNVIKQITTSKNITNFKNYKRSDSTAVIRNRRRLVQTFRVKKKTLKNNVEVV